MASLRVIRSNAVILARLQHARDTGTSCVIGSQRWHAGVCLYVSPLATLGTARTGTATDERCPRRPVANPYVITCVQAGVF